MTVYDYIEPDLSGTVTRIEWEGVYTFCRVEDTEAEPHATAFEIFVHPATEAGGPDLSEQLYTTTIAIADTDQTELEQLNEQPCRDAPNDSIWSWYSYSAEIVDGPTLNEGEPVWIGIRAVAPSFSPFWGWRGSARREPYSQQLFNGNLTETDRTGNRVITVWLVEADEDQEGGE